jgi:hypothetical protein
MGYLRALEASFRHVIGAIAPGVVIGPLPASHRLIAIASSPESQREALAAAVTAALAYCRCHVVVLKLESETCRFIRGHGLA